MSKVSGDDFNKRLAEITFENINKRYLIGKIYEGEVHIKLELIQEYYRINKLDLPHSFLNNIYEVSIFPGRNTHNTKRYSVSNIVKIVKNNTEDDDSDSDSETEAEHNLDRKFQENNKRLMKQFQRMNSQLKNDYERRLNQYEMRFNEYKNKTDVQIMYLENKINVLRMVLQKISNYTFLNDILQF